MNKLRKRITAVILCVTFLFALSGCGSGSSGTKVPLVELGDAATGNSASQGSSSSDYVFSETTLEALNEYAKVGDGGIFYDMEVYDDTLYLVYGRNGRSLGTSEGNLIYYSSWDLNGNQLSDVKFLDTGENMASDGQDGDMRGYTGECLISSDGILYYFLEILSYDESGKNAYYVGSCFKALDTDGTELFSVDILDWPGIEEGEYHYFYFLGSANENTLTVWDGEQIYQLDLEGNLLASTEAEEPFRGQQSPLFYVDGAPVFEIYDSESTSYSYLLMDLITGESAGEIGLMDNFTKYTAYNESNPGYIYAGAESGYDLILSDSYGIYGYDFGNAKETAVIQYQTSDLSVRKVWGIVFLSTDETLICYVGYDDYDHFSVLKKVDSSEVTEKQTLTLAVYGSDYEMDLDRIVSEFNQASDTYRIYVVDYSQYATSEDPEAGITRLNNEIMAGESPDLFFNDINGSFDFNSYAKQGILADFYELMENDPDFEKSDYLENIFEAYEKDGCLYELVPEFQIFTYLGKQSIFGDEPLTWERLSEIMEEYPNAAVFGTDSGENSSEKLLYRAFMFCYEDFIDEEAGTCSFTSDAFKTLLEFIAENTQSESEGGDSLQYIEDRSLLYEANIDMVPYVYYYYYPVFAEDFVAVGFPSESGISSGIIANGSFAISSSGSVEAAWEFVKMFLSEEEQMPDEEQLASYGIPVLKAAVKELTDRMTQKEYRTVNGEKVYSAYETSVGGVVMEIEPASQEEADRWYEYLCSVNRRINEDLDAVMNIVLEENRGLFRRAEKRGRCSRNHPVPGGPDAERGAVKWLATG